MTAIIAMVWPYLAGGVVALGGILFGWLKTKQAQTASAQADAVKADAGKQVAEAKTIVAQTNDAAAQANATAAQAGAQASKDRQDVENAIASEPAGTSQRVLRDQWSND